jgi:5'-nucleotidase
MRILLTNDDGFGARGLEALTEVLSEKHEIYVIAPHSEKSGCSNAFTIHDPLKLYNRGKDLFSLNGFPSDCVNVGLNSAIIPEVDCIVSGINHGPNLGDDIFFSGTVGAARMAYFLGKSGFAVSMDAHHRPSEYFHDAARFVLSFIDEIKHNKQEPVLFNINCPDLPKEKVRGVRFATMSRRKYGFSFSTEPGSEGETLLHIKGDIASKDGENTDAMFLKQGYITVTPLTTDCNDYENIRNSNRQN